MKKTTTLTPAVSARDHLQGPVGAAAPLVEFVNGERSGVDGTPFFFINGTKYDGDMDYESLHTALKSY